MAKGRRSKSEIPVDSSKIRVPTPLGPRAIDPSEIKGAASS